MTFQKTIFLVVLLALSGGLTHAEDKPTQAEVIKKEAMQVGKAMIASEFAKILDYTPPSIVENGGGRKEIIKAMEAMFKKMKNDGYEFKDFSVGDPSEIVVNGKESFVVIPTAFDMSSPKGKIRGKSYLVGISDNDGKTWTFVDGAGLQDKDTRKKALPNLPEKLKLPKAEAPELLPNDK